MEPLTIRKIVVNFFTYLKNIGRCEKVWTREELTLEYNSFKDGNGNISISCSTFLYRASRLKPPILRVRQGTKVILLQNFDKSELSKIELSKSRTSLTTTRPPYQNEQRYRNRYRRTRQKKNRPSVKNSIDAIAKASEKPLSTNQKRYIKPSSVNADSEAAKMPGRDGNCTAILRSSECRKITEFPHAKGEGAVSKVSDDHQKSTYDKVSISNVMQRPKKRDSLEQKEVDAEFHKRKLVPGVRPKFLTGARRTETLCLENFYIPLTTELKHRSGVLYLDSQLRQRLSSSNYVDKFHLLLHIEELQYRKEIQSYAMKSAVLQKKSYQKGLLYLDVPGLAENRPSLLVGDRVYAVRLDSKGNEYRDRYEGFVHGVEQQQVSLGFNPELDRVCQRNMKFSVKFTFNRRPLRLMHNALDTIPSDQLARMLFPSIKPERYVPPKGTLVMKKRDIESNTEQRTAVENIVLGKTPPIYIIFGPPGTGKTVTMVESIYQTYKWYNYNILVCALCNDACDMLASKLQDYVDKSKMIRIYAASRSWRSVPSKIKEGRTNYKDGELYMPDQEELASYQIIVCTFVTAGRISLMGFPSGHFQRIFIDESGQAFEPECLVAVSGILAKDGKLILAGDPKQLGPIVRSPLAIRHGLQMSLLQRLMDTCPIYQKDKLTGEYNSQCVTKLVKNYRSHEVILRISNQHFYDEELLVCADELKRMKMCGWEWLKNKKFPILFHGIEGKQTRDQSSPSYYNPDEVKIVKDYVDKLMESRGTHKLFAPSNIGIVTPYRKQCEKIRKAVEKYPGIDVGSVEVFQGQERPVIIISTVRSSKEGLTDDAKYHLGFLCDPKRFNVALTRAQALLIVVGNPRLLCLDKYWKSLLTYCMQNKSYCGATFSSEDFRGASDMEEIEELFQKICITSSENGGIEDDMAAPFWRIEH